jgi:hypothetical protein
MFLQFKIEITLCQTRPDTTQLLLLLAHSDHLSVRMESPLSCTRWYDQTCSMICQYHDRYADDNKKPSNWAALAIFNKF